MKLSTLALVSLAALSLPANAASITVLNLTGSGNDYGLFDNAGEAIGNGGFVGLYAFGAGDGNPPADAAAAAANGDNGLLSLAVLGPTNNPAPGAVFAGLNFDNPGDVGGPGAVDGQNLYLMFGNGADAASSLAIGLINLGVSPAGSDSPPPGWQGGQKVLDNSLDVLIGSVGGATDVDWTAAGLGTVSVVGLNAQVVPEPSSSMLFGLAGLALLIRRKR